MSKIILITGGSSGIGKAIATYLSSFDKYIIYGTSRVSRNHSELPFNLIDLDVTSTRSIETCIENIISQHGKLDILIANAGLLGTLGPLNHINPQVWEQTIAVNVTANWRLIRSLDPLLRLSNSGRAIFLTSAAAQYHRAFWGLYATSKAALEMIVRTYAQEISQTNITANLFNPGRTQTKMRAEAYPGEDPNTIKTPEFVAKQLVNLALPKCLLNGEIITADEP